MRIKTSLFLTSLICVTFLSGCMVGPDYSRPDTVADSLEKYANQPTASEVEQELQTGRWWESFNDPYINELVDQAIENNYDLKQAAWRVVENQAILGQAFGARLPAFDYQAERKQTKLTPGTNMVRDHEHYLNIIWVADLFGKLRRTERAAMDDLLAQEATQQALIHSVIAQVVKSRIEIFTQQKLVDIAERNIASRQQTVDIVERRYNSGLTDSLQLHQAKENFYAAASTKPSTKQKLQLSRHTMEVLLGQRASTLKVPTTPLPDIPELEKVPASVPASLLDRRPDVRAAEMELVAATERIGVSIAQLYPDLTITLFGGYSGDKYRFTFSEEKQIYSGILGLAAPIYQGGQLREGVKASKARAEQAAAAYAETVIKAIKEVEDALVKEKYLKESVTMLKTRADEALKAETLARDRYSRGLEKLLTVLDTERQRINAENELAQAVNQLYNARVDLYLALGGDWNVEFKNDNLERTVTDE